MSLLHSHHICRDKRTVFCSLCSYSLFSQSKLGAVLVVLSVSELGDHGVRRLSFPSGQWGHSSGWSWNDDLEIHFLESESRMKETAALLYCLLQGWDSILCDQLTGLDCSPLLEAVICPDWRGLQTPATCWFHMLRALAQWMAFWLNQLTYSPPCSSLDSV